MLRLLAALLMLLTGTALAAPLAVVQQFGVDYVSADGLARELGTVATRVGDSVVIRSGSGIITLFAGEPDFMWQPTGASSVSEGRLAVPTVDLDGGLWLPVSLIEQIGGTISGVVLLMPDRTRLVLGGAPGTPEPPSTVRPEQTAGPVPIGGGVSGVRLVADGQSLLLVDPGLLALARPELRDDLDSFNAGTQGYRPLYFVLAAERDSVPGLEVTVSQGLTSSVLSDGNGLVLLNGNADSVAPGAPLSGLLLLPGTTNLRLPMRVQWQEQEVEAVFRR